jgi:glyceraldehyde-3-phosphate dehydrogenase (NADP+)
MPTAADLTQLFPEPRAVPEAHRLLMPVDQTEYLVDGELRQWAGPMEEVVSPVMWRDGGDLRPVVLGHYPSLTETESLAALQAARRAFDSGRGRWPTASVAERIECLERFTHAMREVRAETVRLLMWEIGKTYDDATKEFDRTVDYIRDTLDAMKELDRASSRFVIEQGVLAQIRRAPFGVVLCMGPFNYPLNETFTTLIPALLMGNTVIFKPPKLGVLLHRPLLRAFQTCFPPGVVNTVYGDGRRVVTPLMQSGQVDVLAFIGSCRVADTIKAQHPMPHRLRCVLGLEAKNAAIVLPDADLDLTVSECLLGSLSYNGQRCTALKILYVHRAVLDGFLDRFCRGVTSLQHGMPWDAGVKLTPLPEPNKVGTLTALLRDACDGGGRVVNQDGGSFAGTMFHPAVVCPVSPEARLSREEQFGPLVPVVPFQELSDPLDAVVASRYGQQVSIFGTDPAQIAELVDPLVNQVCRVNINSQCQRGPDRFPFTGRKDSAEGTLSVSDALRVFAVRTLVAAKVTDANKAIITRILRDRSSRFLSTDFIL